MLRNFERLGDTLRQRQCAGGITEREQYSEFVAAKPADQVPGAYRVRQSIRNDLQQGVASRVSVGVIDGLEAVQIDVHDSKALAG